MEINTKGEINLFPFETQL